MHETMKRFLLPGALAATAGIAIALLASGATASSPARAAQPATIVSTMPPQSTTVRNATNTMDEEIPSSSVTATIGPSHQAFIAINCGVATSGAGVEGYVTPYMDGHSISGGLSVSAGAAVNVTSSFWHLYGPLPTGKHTFSLYYRVQNPGAVTFYNPSITIQPR